MPDAAAPAKGIGATLAKKVGPFPLGVWAAAGVGAIWYMEKKKGAGSPGAPPVQGQGNYGTDPAGNTGYINPATGFVEGSPSDVAALQAQQQALSSGSLGVGSAGGGGFTSSGPTSTTGPADTSGQTTGTVNPSGTSTSTPGAPPGPTTATTGAAAPQSKSWRYPKPEGLQASAVSDSGYSLSWSPVQGPNGQRPSTYTVATYQMNGVKVDQFNSGSTSTKEYGSGGKGLHPGWQYKTEVWANGGPQAPPNASVVVTLKPKGTKA